MCGRKISAFPLVVNNVTAEMESAHQKKTVNEGADIPTDLNIAYRVGSI